MSIPTRLIPALLGLWATAAQGQGDAAVFDRIDLVRGAAQAIVIDGDPGDWAGVPQFSDPIGDGEHSASPSLDIVRASFAPLQDDWLLMIEAAGPIPTSGISYRVRVDYREQQARDLELGLNADFTDFLCWWNADNSFGGCGDPNDTPLSIAGNVLEARIPHALLSAHLPAEFCDALAGTSARSWIRLTPFSETFVAGSGIRVVDEGPAIGSFRLIDTPHALDPPLPDPDPGSSPDAPARVGSPLEGIQFVAQGAGGLFSHAGQWGYDFFRTDNALNFSAPAGSPSLSDYLSFGDVLRAPESGTFWSAADGGIDQNPGCTPFDPNQPNGPNFQFYRLDSDPNVGLLFTHMKEGTVAALGPFGTPIAADTILGQVGNSGSCSDPHLHFGAETIQATQPFPSRPIELTAVEVGLNPTEDDPWLRRFSSWGIREGFFFRPARPVCGDLDSDHVLTGADVDLLRGFLADPQGAPLSAEALERCSVIGTALDCDVLDRVVLSRSVGAALAPGVSDVCSAVTP